MKHIYFNAQIKQDLEAFARGGMLVHPDDAGCLSPR